MQLTHPLYLDHSLFCHLHALVSSCLAAQASHSSVSSTVAHSSRLQKKLGCCSFVCCTFGTGNNFKLKCCVERVLFSQQAQEFCHYYLDQLLPWLLTASTTWPQLFDWVDADTNRGRILFHPAQAIVRILFKGGYYFNVRVLFE